eukprot:NODE_896_length_3330_cov_0.347570.p2 type:complete len:114 gc:universal NODE_896_length_3330_cov_0.347570:1191-850(-)
MALIVNVSTNGIWKQYALRLLHALRNSKVSLSSLLKTIGLECFKNLFCSFIKFDLNRNAAYLRSTGSVIGLSEDLELNTFLSIVLGGVESHFFFNSQILSTSEMKSFSKTKLQ